MNPDTMEEVQLIEVEPRPHFRLWLRYSDGVEGEVDVSDMACLPIFRRWHEDVPFAAVGVMPGNLLVWNDDMDMCGDALYLELTGKQPEDIFPNLRKRACQPLPDSTA